MSGTERIRTIARDIVAPIFGMACFWAYLRYPVYFEQIYPLDAIGLGTAETGVSSFSTFLVVLAALSVCCLALWRWAGRLLQPHRAAVACCALAGSVGAALTLAAVRGTGPAWLAWVATPLVAMGFLTCFLAWGSYLSQGFDPRQVLVCSLSYLLSLLTLGPTYRLATWVAPVAVVLIPAGSMGGWLVSTRSAGRTPFIGDTGATTSRAALRNTLRSLSNPTIWLFVSFLLAGSVVRGLVDTTGPLSDVRFRLSAPITALLAAACAAFFWMHRRRGNGLEPHKGGSVTPFALGCWVAFSMLFFAGVLIFLTTGNIELGGSLVVIARSMLEIAFWILLCDLADRRRVAPVPLFIICGIWVEIASWALSYVAVPLILTNSIPDPGAGSTVLALVAVFSLCGVITICLGFALVALGRRRAVIASDDWLPGPSGTPAAGEVPQTPASVPAVDEGPADETLATLLEQRHGLTPREALVAVGYAHGFSLAKVSEGLGITTSAAQTHIKCAYRKLGVHSKDALIEVVDGLRREG